MKKDFYKEIRDMMNEAREMYLNSIGLSEQDVRKNYSKKRHLRNRWAKRYFVIDGVKIWLPTHYYKPRDFIKYCHRGIIEE